MSVVDEGVSMVSISPSCAGYNVLAVLAVLEDELNRTVFVFS